jgi:hypothetical protein
MNEIEQELFVKFEKEIQLVSWELLKPHHSRHALFVVEPHLDLIQISTDVSLDNVKAVKNAMELNLLRYPAESEIKKWEEDPTTNIGKFLIVSPYVFFQVES